MRGPRADHVIYDEAQDTRDDLRRTFTCNGCHQDSPNVAWVTDHVCFCPACLTKYGLVKV